MKFLRFLYNWLVHTYDKVTSHEVELSVGDVMLQRGALPEANQFLATSKVLDIKAYVERSDETFRYQNTFSRIAYGK